MRWMCVALVLTIACGDDSGMDAGSDSGMDASGDSAAPDASVDADNDAEPLPDAGPLPTPDPVIPAPTGTCPPLDSSTLTMTVTPAGLPPRSARIWISEAADTLDGPFIFYWHGTGSSPNEANFGLGEANIAAILAEGGIVVAPESDPAAGTFPWFAVSDATEDRDFRVADELLACAAASVGVDPTRVHSIGMSAGGLQTSQLSFQRSSYIASVVTYSGGVILARRPTVEEPNNRFAALIFHGGPEDIVVISFQDASERYWNMLDAFGQFAAICNHGGRHTIPFDASESVLDFFQAHPWGVTSPWEAGLPEGFYNACSLMP